MENQEKVFIITIDEMSQEPDPVLVGILKKFNQAGIAYKLGLSVHNVRLIK
jgi:hypothetical protein